MKNDVIVGFGVQGKKRLKFLNKKKTIIVDPFNKRSHYKYINDVPKNKYSKVFICVPDKDKEKIIQYCLLNSKHFLVEKPFPLIKSKKIEFYSRIARSKKLINYVAYNHRFEPHFEKVKKILNKNQIGKIYSCKLFYGNGTSTLVKNSLWRDKGLGVISDLGSHLLDLCNYWFNIKGENIDYINCSKFENRSPDYAKLIFKQKNILFDLEMTLCMWRNHFTCDILGEKGSIHISSLCKWDETTLIIRKKVFPSGLPKEKKYKIKMDDPTWKKEHKYFEGLIKKNKISFTKRDIWINNIFNKIKKKLKINV